MIAKVVSGLVALGVLLQVLSLALVPDVDVVGLVADAPVTTQVFDVDAVVVVTVGPDGKPGIANVDDGANGVVDERGELGATGSDDLCLVRFGDQADIARTDSEQLILQQGGFRDATNQDRLHDEFSAMRTFQWVTLSDGSEMRVLRP